MEYHDLDGLTSQVHSFDLEVFEDRKLLDAGHLRVSFAAASSDGFYLAASDMSQYGVHENHSIYHIDNETGILRPRCQFDKSIGNTILTDARMTLGNLFTCHEDHLYFVVTGRKGSELYKYSEKTKLRKIMDSANSIDDLLVEEEKVYAIGMSPNSLQEIFQVDEKGMHLLSQINAPYSPAIRMPIELTFINSQSIEIDGWAIKPDQSNHLKCPAILLIHGGPKAIFSSIFYHEMQMWAEKGFFVLFCNPRGSDGRGNEFADLRGKYGSIDYEDLMEFVDIALETYPQIDPEQLYISGGSYGGFMTNWAIGHTDRFKKAISQRSISNWLSDFCMSDISYNQAEHDHQCTPWNDPEKLWHLSPLKYANRVKTPLLLIHADLDAHCCLADAQQMFTSLKYHGVECKLCIFHGEDHGLLASGKPKNRIARLALMQDWLVEKA